MIDYLSIVETDKVNHVVETDMVKLVVKIESFGTSADELDKETGSYDGLQPKQEDLSCVHALNEPHLHEIHVVPIAVKISSRNHVNHAVETDMVKLVVKIESFGISADELDKETGSYDGLQPKQEDLSCVHALNEPHFHEIHVVPSKHEADQCWLCANPKPV
ncbi:hypothetical protein Tco_1412405 [Tanacetum coccineum]